MYKDYLEIMGDAMEDLEDWIAFEEDMKTNPWGQLSPTGIKRGEYIMKIKKLSAMPYAQAHVEIDKEGNTYLFSYVTLTAILTADGWLEITGLYSRTTRSHIGAFMKEYVTYPSGLHGTFQDAKGCYTGGYRLNIETGEIEDV